MSKQNGILNNLVHLYPEAPEYTTRPFRVSSTARLHPERLAVLLPVPGNPSAHLSHVFTSQSISVI